MLGFVVYQISGLSAQPSSPQITTINSRICKFPFDYNGKTYYNSCALKGDGTNTTVCITNDNGILDACYQSNTEKKSSKDHHRNLANFFVNLTFVIFSNLSVLAFIVVMERNQRISKKKNKLDLGEDSLEVNQRNDNSTNNNNNTVNISTNSGQNSGQNNQRNENNNNQQQQGKNSRQKRQLQKRSVDQERSDFSDIELADVTGTAATTEKLSDVI